MLTNRQNISKYLGEKEGIIWLRDCMCRYKRKIFTTHYDINFFDRIFIDKNQFYWLQYIF